MFGCCNRATASASVRNRAKRVGVSQLLGLDQLQGDEPIELYLAGLEHDAHAAAAQFAENFVAGNGRRLLGRWPRREPEVKRGPGLDRAVAGAEAELVPPQPDGRRRRRERVAEMRDRGPQGPETRRG